MLGNKLTCSKCFQEWICEGESYGQTQGICPSCVRYVKKTQTRSLARVVCDEETQKQAAKDEGFKLGYAKAASDVVNFIRASAKSGNFYPQMQLESWLKEIRYWRTSNSTTPPEL